MRTLSYHTEKVGSKFYYCLKDGEHFDFNGSPVLLQAMLEYFQFSERQIQSIKKLVRFWGLGGVSGDSQYFAVNNMICVSPPQW